jgi:N-glycosylase/DNA lyase
VGKDLAIIDLHVLRLLREYGLIGHFTSMNRQRYMEIEGVLKGIAKKAKMRNGKLDMYLWYFKTNKVSK